jgi:SAM-dependent methyltransferase
MLGGGSGAAELWPRRPPTTGLAGPVVSAGEELEAGACARKSTRRPRAGHLGCATGGFTIAIAEQTGARVIGCDLSLSFLAFARTTSTGLVAWTAGDAQHLPFTDEAQDLVSLLAVIGH